MRLKALMPDAGCRRVAQTFNRIHAARHRMTVSKTWVAKTVRDRRIAIEERRAHWKRRVPRPIVDNQIWGLDLTTKSDLSGHSHPIIGVVDHGSRFAVTLLALRDKSAIAILRVLLDTIERHGRPRAVRTDNDAAFTSRLFGFVLAFLGIRHQRTEPHCPWQNGRVGRFFGTLKQKLDRWAVDGAAQLEAALGDFRDWYNVVRPHQHLGRLTPAEVRTGIDPYARPPAVPHYFSAWGGVLTGFYVRR